MALQAEISVHEHKQYLAKALFYLNVPTSGSIDGDIRRLSTEIAKCVIIYLPPSAYTVLICVVTLRIYSLVESLGLKSYLETFNVPREDLPHIAGLALGNDSHKAYSRVVKILEDLYSP